MVKARGAEVVWDGDKKAWVVRIQVGEDVMRRTCKGAKKDLDDAALRNLAVQTAHDDGCEVAADAVVVKR